MRSGRRARRTAVAVGGLAAVLLASCGTGQDPEPVAEPVDPTPVVVDSAAPEQGETDVALPTQLAERLVVAPGWSEVPQERGGVFLGIAAPDDDNAALRFIAADGAGTIRWEAQRPASCTGFALSGDDAAPVAVLTDNDTSSGAIETTASGYDLTDGRELWGPVTLPGPHVGPGAVFAEPAPGAAMGETGPRTALHPGTGEIVFAEDEDDGALVGEYDGTVLVGEGDELVAEHVDGEERWRLELPGAGSAQSVAEAQPPHGTALLATDEEDGVLVDLDTGEVVARDVSDARLDPASQVLVTLEGDALHAYGPDGGLWSQPAAVGTRLAAAGGVLLYLRTDDAVAVHNVVTGEVAEAYEPGEQRPLAVPVVLSEDGAAALRTSAAEVVLSTTTYPEETNEGEQGDPAEPDAPADPADPADPEE